VEEDDEEEAGTLPALKEGRNCCASGGAAGEDDPAPKPFTDATLLAAMTGIARYVQDPEIRKTLRETDGLGTEATRAGIIDLLFKRRFLVRQGKSIKATPTGRALVQALPTTATTPDMTALWEQSLGQIAERHGSYQQFMGPLTEQLNGLIEGARQDSGASFSALPKAAPGDSKQRFARRKRTGSTAARPARARARVLVRGRALERALVRGRPGARLPEAGERRDHIKIRRGPVAPLCMDGAAYPV
jgi:DNA topoisomerase-3